MMYDSVVEEDYFGVVREEKEVVQYFGSKRNISLRNEEIYSKVYGGYLAIANVTESEVKWVKEKEKERDKGRDVIGKM